MAIERAYELAYREAVRALEQQRAEATELQSRAGMLLAAAAIATSLVGREAFGSAPLLAWLAILCFVLLTMCVLVVVWPHAGETFSADPRALLSAHLANDAPDPTSLSLDLIARIATHHRVNAQRLAQMSTAFRIGACLLAIQMLLTLIVTAVTV
jgi:cytochrome c-type biogenesis protein CcmH/NrfG